MQLILVTDIFGLTKPLLTLAEMAREHGYTVQLIDPYNGEHHHFNDEATAYEAFISQCGHQRYTQFVQQALNVAATPVHLVGFSSGASAVWNAADGKFYEQLQHITAFYPSQIRHNITAEPSVPATLIFPQAEAHFNVDDVIIKLRSGQQRHNIACIKTPYQHGFMNACCRSFSAEGFARYLPLLFTFSSYTTSNTQVSAQ